MAGLSPREGHQGSKTGREAGQVPSLVRRYRQVGRQRTAIRGVGVDCCLGASSSMSFLPDDPAYAYPS